MVDKDITIEDLVAEFPKSVSFLMNKGIHCMACGEPVWGTLEEQAKEKGFDDVEIGQVVEELNQHLEKEQDNK